MVFSMYLEVVAPFSPSSSPNRTMSALFRSYFINISEEGGKQNSTRLPRARGRRKYLQPEANLHDNQKKPSQILPNQRFPTAGGHKWIFPAVESRKSGLFFPRSKFARLPQAGWNVYKQHFRCSYFWKYVHYWKNGQPQPWYIYIYTIYIYIYRERDVLYTMYYVLYTI